MQIDTDDIDALLLLVITKKPMTWDRFRERLQEKEKALGVNALWGDLVAGGKRLVASGKIVIDRSSQQVTVRKL